MKPKFCQCGRKSQRRKPRTTGDSLYDRDSIFGDWNTRAKIKMSDRHEAGLCVACGLPKETR